MTRLRCLWAAGLLVATLGGTLHAQAQEPTWPREPEYESAPAAGTPAVHLYVIERDGQLAVIADRGDAVAVDAMMPRPEFARDAAERATRVTMGGVVHQRLQVGPEGGVGQLRATRCKPSGHYSGLDPVVSRSTSQSRNGPSS